MIFWLPQDQQPHQMRQNLSLQEDYNTLAQERFWNHIFHCLKKDQKHVTNVTISAQCQNRITAKMKQILKKAIERPPTDGRP